MSDPYRRAGLDRNPFAAEPYPGVDAGLWVERGLPAVLEERAGHLVQVIGSKGAGKSSHLLRWRTMMPGPYRHVPPGIGRFSPLPVAPVVYWDEADRAAWLRVGLAAVARRGSMVVAGTHHDLTEIASRAGVSLETHRLPRLDEETVAAYARRRLSAVGGEAHDWADLPYAQIARQAGSSLREAGRLLHMEVAVRVADRGLRSR